MPIKVTGMNELNKYIKDVEKFLKAPKKFFARASVIGQANVLRHFQNEVGPTGKWKGLRYRQGRVLQDTGRLRNSIAKDYDSKNAVIGSNLLYARIHNKGGMAGRGRKVRIPKREFLWLDKNAYRQMENAMVTLLEKQ